MPRPVRAWTHQNYHQKSISLLEQAVQKDPSNPGLYLNLARAYSLRYDYPALERCIENALRFSQSRVEIFEEAAGVICTIKHVDLMLGYLERASQKKGVSIRALTSLADIYILDNRFDDAAEIVERMTGSIAKTQACSMRSSSQAAGTRGSPVAEAESEFRALQANSAADLLTRVRAGCALASILDGAGQYDDAMTALLEVKAIQRPSAAPLAAPLQQMQQLHNEMGRSITTAILDRWRADASKLQPPGAVAAAAHRPPAASGDDSARTSARRA